MGTQTKIEWTDATWNPILGCSRVSEGCRNCYAETIAGRFGGGKETVYSGLTHIVNGRAVWTGQIKETKKLLEPLSWRTPKRVFVNSMSDLFHENVTDEMRDRIFAVMALTPKHTYQILTKRPERMLAYFSGLSDDPDAVRRAVEVCNFAHTTLRRAPRDTEFDALTAIATGLPNVWLGVSVEGQEAADKRIPLLLQTPAVVRFISAEPLLGPVSLEELPSASGIGRYLDALSTAGVDPGALIPTKLDWVICGGESGPGARPMHPDWARSLRDQCQSAGVPFFFKQHGEWLSLVDYDPFVHGADTSRYTHQFAWKAGAQNADELPISSYRVGKKAAGALLDGREWKQFPEAR